MEQLIYTRCYPHRALERDMAVDFTEGFGVFTGSNVPHGIDLNMLKQLFEMTNASSADDLRGLFTSYDYLAVGEKNVLLQTTPRPFMGGVRNDGKLHRPGSYVKHVLIGDDMGFAGDWFGDQRLNAADTPENDYYLPPCEEPPRLPTLHGPGVGWPTRENVDEAFLQAHQEELGIITNYILTELAKPVGRQRPIVVKKLPGGMEKIVAALKLLLPLAVARKVSFSTNWSLENSFFYKRVMTDEGVPYALLFGVHPADKNVRSLRSCKEYVLAEDLDTPTELAQAYFVDARDQTDEYKAFRDIICPGLSRLESEKLTALYAAYKTLFSGRGTDISYTEACQAFSAFSAAAPVELLGEKLLKIGKVMYTKLAEEDVNNGFALVKAFLQLGPAGKDTATECVSYLLGRGMNVQAVWTAVKAAGAGMEEIARAAVQSRVDVFRRGALLSGINSFNDVKALMEICCPPEKRFSPEEKLFVGEVLKKIENPYEVRELLAVLDDKLERDDYFPVLEAHLNDVQTDSSMWLDALLELVAVRELVCRFFNMGAEELATCALVKDLLRSSSCVLSIEQRMAFEYLNNSLCFWFYLEDCMVSEMKKETSRSNLKRLKVLVKQLPFREKEAREALITMIDDQIKLLPGTLAKLFWR